MFSSMAYIIVYVLIATRLESVISVEFTIFYTGAFAIFIIADKLEDIKRMLREGNKHE